MTKLFFDTEFTGLHQQTTLISLGIIAETGETFYAEFTDYDIEQADNWLFEHVLSKLGKVEDNTWDSLNQKDWICVGDSTYVAFTLLSWLKQFDKVEMWSDCLHYDWVLFIDLFGNAFNLPDNIYYIPFDICTLFKIKGIDPDISREKFVFEREIIAETKHHALWDAIMIKKCYEKLIQL